MARHTATQAEIEWVIAAKKLDTECPQRGAYPSTETYWAAYTGWWDARIALEKMSPLGTGVRVRADDIAAYEATKGTTT